jgi:hypothetical protein
MDHTLHRGTLADESLAVAENRLDRDRSLHALHELELRAGRPAPGREVEWLQQTLDALSALEAMVDNQQGNSSDADSTLSDIQRDEPRLHNRVVRLRRGYRNVHQAISRLRAQLEATPPAAVDITDVRQQLDRVATELRYQRAQEADLVYEAYNVDLGTGD